MSYYIHEIFTTEGPAEEPSDYDLLSDYMSSAVEAAHEGDAQGLNDILDEVTGHTAQDGSVLISEEQFDAWIADSFKPSPTDEFQRLDEHFSEKTTLKEIREQSFDLAQDKDPKDGYDDRLEEIAAAYATGQGELGEAILQNMYDAAAAGEATPALDLTGGKEKIAATLANRSRWSEQCFLANHIQELAGRKSFYNRDYKYIDTMNGRPSEFMNRLHNRPHSGKFMDINPDDASELTPYFRLYKVLYSWEDDGKGGWKTKYESEVPIIFESMARQDLFDYDVGKTQLELANIKGPDGDILSQPEGVTATGQGVPATGYSWDKFEWTYKGSNPETVRNDITAQLVLTFQDFNQLSKWRVHVPDPTKAEPNPDPVSYSLLDLLGYGPASYKRQENRADEYHEKFFEIKVVCGWNPHNFRNDPAKEHLAKAVENQRVTMYLTLIDHEFDISDLGTFTLHLSYRARLETVLTEPKADVLAHPNYRDSLADINKEIALLKKACDWEGLREAKNRYFEEIEKHRRQNLENIIAELTSCGPGPIFPEDLDRQSHDNLPITLNGDDASGLDGRVFLAQPLITDLAAFANGVRDPASIEPSGQIYFEAADGSSATAQLDESLDQINANWASGGPSNTDSADNILGVLQEVTASNEINGDRVNVPFVYLGDLLEVAADMALDQNNFETGELVSLTPNEANRIKIILGPYEFFNGTENFIVNLADVPISLRAFTDFWYKNVVAARRENYLLLHFVRDVIEKLVVDALGADCFAFNGHPLGGTPVRLRTSFLTLYPQQSKEGGPRYPDPLLNLDPSTYANSDSEGYGTIKLSELNKIPDIADDSESPENCPAEKEKLSPVEAINQLKTPSMEELYNVEDLTHYLVIYAESKEPWDLAGCEVSDAEKGIFHMRIHRGVLHSARFKKTDQPHLREARYQKTGYNPLVHLSNVYNVNLSMLGNTLFYPGSYVYINPLGFGTSLGSPTNHEGPSISNVMGLGGYHFIIDVTNRISKTFTTEMGVRWDNNGSGSPRTLEGPTRKSENADCPPVP